MAEQEITNEEAADVARDVLIPGWRHAELSDDAAIDALAAESDGS